MPWIKDHWLYLLCGLVITLFLISEALSHSTRFKANGVFQAVANALLPVVKAVPVIGPVAVALSNLEHDVPPRHHRAVPPAKDPPPPIAAALVLCFLALGASGCCGQLRSTIDVHRESDRNSARGTINSVKMLRDPTCSADCRAANLAYIEAQANAVLVVP